MFQSLGFKANIYADRGVSDEELTPDFFSSVDIMSSHAHVNTFCVAGRE